jgi:hypothetical protein
MLERPFPRKDSKPSSSAVLALPANAEVLRRAKAPASG